VIARLFNTIGPRQTGRYGMVVPRFVKQGLGGDRMTVYGDGTQLRCFMHVGDAVRALVGLMARSEAYGEVYNLGNDTEISIMDLAKTVQRMTGMRSEIVTIPYGEAYEHGFEDITRRMPALDKIQQLLGWRPQIALEQILTDVIDHHNKNSGHSGSSPSMI
jgi:UDP-glucose 4-epimerase